MSIYRVFQSKKVLFFCGIIAMFSFGIRAYISFSQELLIGNGGYYPLQVRTILERGELAFPDMPLLFYFDAGIVKLISFFGIEISDQLIIKVVQVVDSLSIPLLLIPIYQLLKLTKNTEFSYSTVLIFCYGVLSFYSLNLITTSQKNSLGITFLFFAILWLMKYLLLARHKKYLLLSLLFLMLTGLTHFGSFVFGIIASTIFILFQYKNKAFGPLIILLIVGLSIIYFFDPVRFERLISIRKELFSSFPRLPDLIQVVIYGGLAILAVKGLKKFKNHFNEAEKAIIATLIALLIILPLPIIDHQFTHRLTGFLFIPQLLLILFFSPLIADQSQKIVSGILGLVSVGSILFILLGSPRLSLTKDALKDLKQLKQSISDPKNTVIISRHNLEFWVAWTLNVNVSQESKFDSTLISDYAHIYILNQTKGIDTKPRPPQEASKERNHFNEPLVPSSSILLDSTDYFKLYKYQ